jgi:ankyrin repeat protein
MSRTSSAMYSNIMWLVIFSFLMAGAACARQGSGSMTNSPFSGTSSAALADAVKAADLQQIKTLIAQGASPNAQGAKGMPILHWAMLNQSRTAFEALLNAGADPTQGNEDGLTAVHLAAMADTTWWLEKLLERKVSPDTPNTVTQATPLMSALMAERAKNVDLLLLAGANPNASDRQGSTALHIAASINESGRVLQLLEAGANPMARNKLNVTFQRYLFMTPEQNLNAPTRAARERVREWLRSHNIEIEDPKAR